MSAPVIALCAACDPLPVADVTLLLRQPAARDLIEESDAIARDIVVDERDFGAVIEDPTAAALAFSIELLHEDEDEDTEARVMSVTLTGENGGAFAFGRAPRVLLPTIRDVRAGARAAEVRVPILFGPLQEPALLSEDLGARREPIVCGAADGRVWILGGLDGATAIGDGGVLDVDRMTLADDPIALAEGWTRGDCLLHDGQPLLFGGCEANNTALNWLRALDDPETQLLGDVFAGCGARLRQGPGDELWFVTPESAELRRLSDGFTTASAVLDERNAPQAASTTTGDLVLSRGLDNIGQLVPSAIGVIAGDGSQITIPELAGAVLADFQTARDPLALLPDGDIKSVTRSGLQFGVRQIRTVDLSALTDVVVEQLVVFGADDRIAVLSSRRGDTTRTLLIESPDGALVAHTVTRDRIALGPAQSLILAGGELAGVDVIMLR